MNIFQKSDEFDAWLVGLKDHVGKAQIALRLDRAAKGNFGDCESVGEGVCDIRHAIEMARTLSKE
jgi:putative addiction module killer protein